jgi:hypothetical protein
MQLSWRKLFTAPTSLAPGRRTAVEHLDRPDIDPAEKARSHRDLERLSRLPFQFGPLRGAVLRLAERRAPPGHGPLRLVELGAGSGWAGLRLGAALARRGHDVDLLSTDVDPALLPAPGRRGRLAVRPARLDAVRDSIPEADITVANLLIHHLDRAGAVRLLAAMGAASRLGGAVFDLDRNAWAFHFLRVFFPLWALSPITCADALISVQQAFRPEELVEIAREAGIERPRIDRYLGLRMLLSWESSANPGVGP